MDIVSEVVGLRQNSTYYHVNDGYYFLYSETNRNTVYLKCIEQSRSRCMARATMPLTPELRTSQSFIVTKTHNHEPDNTLLQVIQLRTRILQRCQEETLDHRTIFDEECRR